LCSGISFWREHEVVCPSIPICTMWIWREAKGIAWREGKIWREGRIRTIWRETAIRLRNRHRPHTYNLYTTTDPLHMTEMMIVHCSHGGIIIWHHLHHTPYTQLLPTPTPPLTKRTDTIMPMTKKVGTSVVRWTTTTMTMTADAMATTTNISYCAVNDPPECLNFL